MGRATGQSLSQKSLCSKKRRKKTREEMHYNELQKMQCWASYRAVF
jgi:hypothetical protein